MTAIPAEVDMQSDSIAVCILLLIVPIALLALFLFKENLSFIKGRLFLFATGLCAIGLGTLLYVWNSVNGMFAMLHQEARFYDDLTIDTGGSIGLFLSLLFYILIGTIAVGFVMAIKKNSQK